jgi:murein DD-endopeptidase MepM/ murein hydrolase activator NlpD
VVLEGKLSMDFQQIANAPRSQGMTSLIGRSLAIASSLTVVSAFALLATPVRAEEAEANGAAAPVETTAESLLRPQVPAPEVAPATAPVEPVAPAPAAPTPAPQPYEGSVIDPTDYGIGATPSPDTPTVVFSERSSGCRFTAGQGSRSCGGEAASPSTAAVGSNPTGAAAGNVRVGPVTVGVDGVTVGNTTLISREAINETLRPLNVLRRGVEEFVFPLATPAPITSLFGWRTHPIFGDQRMHTGTDLGAPTGTPVLAAKAGTVQTADYLGGYGLTVILRHEDGTQETRYAHLSQLLVRPGETVAQGDVVGLVGSTGNSTGPHLHFELRQLTAQGWVLINPNELLDYAMGNFVHNLNQPIQALGALTGTDGDVEVATEAVPFRPAQPNAS